MASAPPRRMANTSDATRRRWTWTVGTLFGIRIRLHATLVLLLAWIAFTYASHGGIDAAFVGTTIVVSTFAFVVAHELGHALVARHYGCRTREILLLPIGGISSLEHMPEDPVHELAVAIAGPTVNAILAVLFAALVAGRGGDFVLDVAGVGTTAVATQLMYINVGLALFNLLPAFPMDGGRMLRGLLAARLGRTRATTIATIVGKAFAAAFIAVGLAVNPILALIGVFVWLASSEESATVHLRALVANVSVGTAMVRTLAPVDAEASLESVAEQMVATGATLVPVTRAGLPIGVISAEDVAGMLAMKGVLAPVGAIAHATPTISVDDSLDHALDEIGRTSHGALLVVDHGALVGVITVAQLAMYAAIRAPRRTIAAWRPTQH